MCPFRYTANLYTVATGSLSHDIEPVDGRSASAAVIGIRSAAATTERLSPVPRRPFRSAEPLNSLPCDPHLFPLQQRPRVEDVVEHSKRTTLGHH